MLSESQTQANIFADPGDTQAVIFEAPSRLAKFQATEIWIGATGADDNWGGCNVLVSMDGSTYLQVGTIEAQARLGTLASTFASGVDPDSTNSLVVNLAENSPALDAGTTADADQGTTLCYVDGEIIAYSACSVTGQGQHTMDTYIRRGLRGSVIGSHAAGSQFMRLDDAVFQFDYDPTWVGRIVYFKFQSFNSFDNAAQDPSTLTAISFLIPGQAGTEPPAQSTDITNPDFEIDSDLPPHDWQFPPSTSVTLVSGAKIRYGTTYPITLDYDTTAPFAGSRSLRGVTAGGGSGTALIHTKRFVVRPGDAYEISAALKGVGGAAGVAFSWLDASGNALGGDLVAWRYGDWAVAYAQGSAPAGAVAAVVKLLWSCEGVMTAEWDSVKLTPARLASITYVIEGGGSVVTTGVKGQVNVPANCTVNGWVLTADQSGSAVVDVLRSTYAGFPTTSSIAGTDKPTLSSAQKNQNTGPLSAWGSTALSAGDIVQFSVSSCTTCKRLVVTLNVSIAG